MQASPDMSYCGPPPLPENLWGRWNFDPWLIGLLAVASLAFLLRPSIRQQQRAFLGAMVLLVMIFISPLCALTVALFSARVVHHVLLVALAAPLLAWALLWQRDRLANLLTPLTALHAVTFWIWHAPDAYQLALTSTPVYWLMQATLLGSAVLLWSAIFAASSGKAIGALLFLTIQMGLLGALLVFSSSPLYAPHFTTTIPFGLGAHEDQQLAGLIMWVPASLPYMVVGLWRLVSLLRAETSAEA
ncbi:MAG: cytochrome c oxidase assembly protein [Candidatus Devosia phytovorans]|uniref:Cytochrome c oxidase assembly protein n=1 Tax=Candidatus Devosia phytovorans TaxID=3121372 RepID=A0AAJ6AZJ2_9HYPH|nr:cytochrome c oxidase assembly protein [Devosia sp.]WEK03861.1 MAG: cytochrome c oxidase assembly protein [Devosia sp.]